MKRFILVAALAYGCAQEPQTATDTIAPAAGRPAPTPSSALPNRPPVTTSGSPPPALAAAPGSTLVQIEPEGIRMRKLLPQGQLVFHVTNRTPHAHELTLRGTNGSASASVPSNGETVLQWVVGPGPYELVCTVPGHTERAAFDTYVAGTSLDVPGEPRTR